MNIDELLRNTLDELGRVREIENRLSNLREQTASPAIEQPKFSADLEETYESIALPRGQFGRVAVTLDSEEEASLCDSIDEQFDRLARSRATAVAWRSSIALIIEQVEQLVHLNSDRLQTALCSAVNDVPARCRTALRNNSAAFADRAAA